MLYEVITLKLNPGNVNSWIGIGMVATRQYDYSRAISAFSQATKRNPKKPNVWVLLGDAQYEQGDCREAVTSRITSYNVCYTKLLRKNELVYSRFCPVYIPDPTNQSSPAGLT